MRCGFTRWIDGHRWIGRSRTWMATACGRRGGRCGRLAELALESPLEWLVVDALRNAGVEHRVLAGDVAPVKVGVAPGHARILVDGST
jgi:hypothetical protein